MSEPRHRPGEQSAGGRQEDHDRGDRPLAHVRNDGLLGPGGAAGAAGAGTAGTPRRLSVRRDDERRGRARRRAPPSARVPSAGRCAGSLRRAAAASAARSGGASGPQLGIDRGRRRMPVHVHQGERVVRHERQRARQHPKQDHAEGVDVARRRRPALRIACSGERYAAVPSTVPASVSVPAAASAAGEPEVGELRPAFLVEQDVRRLEVAVDEAARRGGAPGLPRCRVAMRRRLVCVRSRPSRQTRLERPAGQPLEPP